MLQLRKDIYRCHKRYLHFHLVNNVFHSSMQLRDSKQKLYLNLCKNMFIKISCCLGGRSMSGLIRTSTKERLCFRKDDV